MALTSTFSTIAAAQTDANSVIDEPLMDAIRQDIEKGNALSFWFAAACMYFLVNE